MNKNLIKMIYKTAKDFHAAGVMSDQTMREFDILCLPPVKILHVSTNQANS